ncbi:hypothetical protein [Aureimonas glaciei]|uniref:Uncharacterized protein n=1 Tax=Aureimonas glaciei TaxID=1776957 RepID=A0A917DEA6_9HYPH|nr:hypothetical protein [Aureimonas glaciei]GGD29952.1 hypothetical protein GCM10011335_36270 [Aureimonas glaciei]
MSAMEKSLRRALDAGDASDPQFRDSIYTASERALERLLQANPIDEDAAHARRVRLAETINRIEADYFVAFGVAGEEGATEAIDRSNAATPSLPGAAVNHREEEERFVAESEGSLARDDTALPPSWAGGQDDLAADSATPGESIADGPADGLRAGQDATVLSRADEQWRAKPKPSRRRRAFGLAASAVLLALLVGIYWLYGAIVTPLGTQENTAGNTAAGAASAEWISIFDGKQLDAIATPSGGTVDSVTVREEPAVRFAPAAVGGEINVAIGPGVVREIQGRNVRVEVVAGSSDGANREFAIRCLFAGETVCARQRFQTSQARDTFVFDMAVPAGADAAGALAIDPTLAAPAVDLDLYSIRLQTVLEG